MGGFKLLVTGVGGFLEVVLVDLYCPFRGPSSGLLDPVVSSGCRTVSLPPVVLTIEKRQRVKEVGKEKRVSLWVLCSVPLVWFGSGLVLHRGSEGVLSWC